MNNMMSEGMGAPQQPADQCPDGNCGDLAGVHIDPADNGYNMHAHYDRKNPKKGFPEPKHTVHKNRQDLMDHLDDVLAAHEHGKKPPIAKRTK